MAHASQTRSDPQAWQASATPPVSDTTVVSDTTAPPGALPAPEAILARASGENFPVASRVLPRALRQDLIALYGFARLADEIGDGAVADPLRALDWLDGEIDRAAAGTARHPLLVHAGTTIRRHHLPTEPFHDLVEANRQDQSVLRYATFEELVDYCRLSAVPVGRMVLGVLGAATPPRVTWSDDVCIALQLVEHCQDVFEDAARGRIYLPAEDLRRLGCDEDDVLACRPTPALRSTVALQTHRARALLAGGAPLAASLPGRFRLAVAAFAGGGLAVVDELADAGFAPQAPGAAEAGTTVRRARRHWSAFCHTARIAVSAPPRSPTEVAGRDRRSPWKRR